MSRVHAPKRTRPATPAMIELPWHATAALLLEAHRLVMLVGEPGSGKTSWAQQAALDLAGKAPESLQGTPETELSQLWGLYTLVGAETRFVDGPLPRALKRGAALLVEELNLVPLETRAHLLALRGQPQVVNPVNGEVLTVPASFRLLATSNPESLSCYRNGKLAEALYDDFLILEVPALGRREIEALAAANHPEADPQLRERAVTLWERFSSLPEREEKNAGPRPSFRAVGQFLKLRTAGLDEAQAIQVAFVNKFITDPDAHGAAKFRASLD